MEIVVMECADCGTLKSFWLRSGIEEGFRCRCGAWRLMRNYFSGGYEDYFISLLPNALTLEGLLDLAQKEHMQINPHALRQSLSRYDLDHLTEQEFYDLVHVVLTSDDKLRFRQELMRMDDLDSIAHLIAKHNPRIDIPGLRDYLKDKACPLSEAAVIEMEKAIEARLYHPEVYQVTEW